MGEIIENEGTDYPYRIYVNQSAWAEVMAEMATGIDYPNFKESVMKSQGPERAHLYSRVWSILYGAEERLRHETQQKR
jgi:hypothetical protein